MRRLTEHSNPELIRRARRLREEMTPEEEILWRELRGNRLGAHFRRQQPLGSYIVDFNAHGARLAVELDGSQHSRQQGHDRMRDDYFARLGFRVLRFANHQVRDDLISVLGAIAQAIKDPNP